MSDEIAVRGVSCGIHREGETQSLLNRRTQQLEALIHFSSRFVEVQTEEEVVCVLRELMRQTLDFEYVAVYLRRQNGLIEKAQMVGDRVVWESMELELVEDVTRLRDVLLGRIPHFVSQDALRDVSDIERDLWVRLLGSTDRVFSNAVVPIRGRTQVLGALAVDRRDTGEPITDSELSMLLTIGRYTGLALDNVRLMQDLRVAEERLRHLVQNLPVTVWELKGRAPVVRGVTTDIAETDPVVEANRSELHEVFTNLVINACDAMPHGGTITLTLREQNGHALVDVADTGVGMTPEVREHCFDAFFTTKGEGGSGLGLPVRRAVLRTALTQLVCR
ncbi:MAG: GAF domain-containing sensor histidine kinase [Armatimonadota bacterium]